MKTIATVASLIVMHHLLAMTPASVMGTYGLETQTATTSHSDGCWLETAPAFARSIRVQIRCTTATPGHHIGAVDARLRWSGSTVVYKTTKFGGDCRITIQFTAARALVSQRGNDSDCGFGAFVNVGGTYHRISRARPRFDLFPVERG